MFQVKFCLISGQFAHEPSNKVASEASGELANLVNSAIANRMQ